MADKKSDVNEVALTTEQVRNLLQVGFYVARWPTGNRDLSCAYNVLQKIYRGIDGTWVPLKSFYQCWWCKSILNYSPGRGTTPLLRHVNTHCASRPNGYVLPAENLHLQNHIAGLPLVAPQLVPTTTAPPVEDVPPAVDIGLQQPFTEQRPVLSQSSSQSKVQANVNSKQPEEAVQHRTSVEFVDVGLPTEKASEIGKHDLVSLENADTSNAQLAAALAQANQIGVLYGPVSSKEFAKILPNADGQW